MKTCLLAGTTGLTGQHLLPLLQASDKYEEIHLLLRRPLDMQHPKIRQHIIDFEGVSEWNDISKVDHVYCCLGTTQKKAGSKANFYKVDHDFIVGMGELAGRLGASCYTFISSIGADANSWTSFYLKVKGETERDIKALNLPLVYALRPSLLTGPREEYRAGEAWGERFATLMSPLMSVGPFRRYKPIHVQQLAEKMLALTLTSSDSGFQLIESEQI